MIVLNGDVNKLIESSLSTNRAEQEQAAAAEDQIERQQRTNRWATILRLLAVAFLVIQGAVSVFVYLLEGYSGGNGDPLFAVAAGVIAALWLGLATALCKDFVWLANAFRGFQN